jgi:preprotein translocase subunit SecA
VLKYDDVLNRQRHVIYDERRRVLEGADLHEQIREMVDEVVSAYVTGATSEGFPEEWDLDQLWTAFRQLYRPTLTIAQVEEEAGGDRAGLSREFLIETIKADAQTAYDRREEELTPEVTRELERRVVLSVLDRKWREHLYEMDYLREGIGLRAMAQRDPLIEYQREGYDLFNNMMEGIKEESVGNLFNLQVEVQPNPIVAEAGEDVPPGLTLTAAPAPPATPATGRPAPQQGRPAQARGRGRHAAPDDAPQGASANGGQAGGARQQGAGQQRAGQQESGGSLVAPGLSRPQRPSRLSYSAPSEDVGGQVERHTEAAGDSKFAKVGRNAPCPCGSGRKYKLCHGDPRNRANA